MRFIVIENVVLSREPSGPLAARIKPLAESLNREGYGIQSIHRHAMLAACFSAWLGKRKVKIGSIASKHVEKYLCERSEKVQVYASDATALRHVIEFLRGCGVVRNRERRPTQTTPVEQLTCHYEQYLRETRLLAEATIINYVPFVRDFLRGRFGRGRVSLSRLTANDVIRFVQRKVPHLHTKRAKLMTTALRSFLRYARLCGDPPLDLEEAVPVVANWSMPAVPRAISPDAVRQLLTSVDRRTAIGSRNYAILLLLARLGLRSSEVVFLELDDIDWKAGQLSLRGKRGSHAELPLPAEVGEAIADYLRRGRPRGHGRRVFLRAKAPLRGFIGPSGVGSVVRDCVLRAGVGTPTYGTHQFRHGLATEMLRHGASLTEIGEVLRHRHPQTTKIYIHVDVDALRTLALPWPGGPP